MPLVFARLRRLSYFYFCDTPMMAAILCYSGDSSDSVIATFSSDSDGLSHLLPSDSKDTCEHLEKSDRLLADAESVDDYQSVI